MKKKSYDKDQIPLFIINITNQGNRFSSFGDILSTDFKS